MKAKLIFILMTCCILAISLTSCKNNHSSSKNGSNDFSSDEDTNITTEIDEDCFDKIKGDYQSIEDGDIGGWWHLTIYKNDSNQFYLTIYDNEAGNPGVEGIITYLDEAKITIKYSKKYYEQLPTSNWNVSDDYLELNYKQTEKGIEFTQNNFSVFFKNENAPDYLSCCWKTDNSFALKEFKIENDVAYIKGDIYQDNETWDNDRNTTHIYFLHDEYTLTDNLISHKNVSIDELNKMLSSDDYNNCIIEITLVNNNIANITLTPIEESRLKNILLEE